MNGYCNLASSPPAAAGKEEEGKREGVSVVGAATLARNISSASQRFSAAERSNSTNGHRGGGGLQAVVRRAFSMRRQPASRFTEGYWRIHDGLDGDDDAAEAGQQVLEDLDGHDNKKGVQQDTTTGNGEIETGKKKKRGQILKAWKKLLGF